MQSPLHGPSLQCASWFSPHTLQPTAARAPALPTRVLERLHEGEVPQHVAQPLGQHAVVMQRALQGRSVAAAQRALETLQQLRRCPQGGSSSTVQPCQRPSSRGGGAPWPAAGR
jgi:hypothetical protein